MGSKGLLSNISVRLRNEKGKLVSFNGQRITFWLSIRKIKDVFHWKNCQKNWQNQDCVWTNINQNKTLLHLNYFQIYDHLNRIFWSGKWFKFLLVLQKHEYFWSTINEPLRFLSNRWQIDWFFEYWTKLHEKYHKQGAQLKNSNQCIFLFRRK